MLTTVYLSLRNINMSRKTGEKRPAFVVRNGNATRWGNLVELLDRYDNPIAALTFDGDKVRLKTKLDIVVSEGD